MLAYLLAHKSSLLVKGIECASNGINGLVLLAYHHLEIMLVHRPVCNIL